MEGRLLRRHGVRRASYFVSRFDRWRGVELTSARKRLQLARSLEGAVRELHGPVRLPGASPLNRIGPRPHEQELSGSPSGSPPSIVR
jgi:hypothetical protein